MSQNGVTAFELPSPVSINDGDTFVLSHEPVPIEPVAGGEFYHERTVVLWANNFDQPYVGSGALAGRPRSLWETHPVG